MTGIPLAAPPTSPTPGFWLTVNLKPQNVAPGSQGLRGLILAPSNTVAGTNPITADTEVRSGIGLTDAQAAGGVGSLASLMFKRLSARFPTAQIDLVAPTGSGGAAATGTFTFTGTPSLGYVIRWTISGRIIDVPWNAGDAPDTAKATCLTYIGRYVDDLLAAATTGGTGAVLFTSKAKGPVGNDISIRCQLIGGTGGTVTPTGITNGKLTGGTTEPDFTTALATVSGIEYDFIGLAISNADAASTTGNVAKALAHVNALNSGPQSKLSQIIAGHTGLRTGLPSAAAAQNDQVVDIVNAQNADDLPCEVGGSEMGDRMNFRSLYFSYNRINNPLPELYGSPNPVADNPTTPQSDAALLAGISLLGYSQNGDVYVIRSVTTYTATSTGAQVLPTDCNEIDAIYEYAKDLRASIPVEFAHARVIRNLTDESQDEIPEGCVEERDILAFIVKRTGFWIGKGVIDGAKFNASLAASQLIVKVDDTDETQVDIFIPASAVKNLAKFSVYMQKAS